MNAIWNDFSDNSVAAVGGTVMQYAHGAGVGFFTADLVKSKKGTCNAWASFLVDVLSAQGISATDHEVEPSDPNIPGFTLTDIRPGERGGEILVNPGPAQGSGGLDYAERLFDDHKIVKISGITWDRNVYDPSYGRKFEAMTVAAAEQAWEDASVQAYRYWVTANATGMQQYKEWYLDRKGVDEVDIG